MRGISPNPLNKKTTIEALNKEIIPLLRELRTAVLNLVAWASSGVVATHASTHITAGTDPVVGDLLDISAAPVNYVPGPVLGLHLTGIDDALSPYLVYVPEPASHVFIVSDAFKTIGCTHAAAVTHTIPLNLYPMGTVIRFLWVGTGQPTIATAGTLIAPDGAKVSAINKFVFAEQVALNTWLLSGSCAP